MNELHLIEKLILFVIYVAVWEGAWSLGRWAFS
jgi:hypothetical protein